MNLLIMDNIELDRVLRNARRFCCVHTVRHVPAGNPNAGEDGLPKTIPLNGNLHTRISPQANKAALITHPFVRALATRNPTYSIPIRTRTAAKAQLQKMVDDGESKESIYKAAAAAYCLCRLTCGKPPEEINMEKVTDSKIEGWLREIHLDAAVKSTGKKPKTTEEEQDVFTGENAKKLHNQNYLFEVWQIEEFQKLILESAGGNRKTMPQNMLKKWQAAMASAPPSFWVSLLGNFSPGDGYPTVQAALACAGSVSTTPVPDLTPDYFVANDRLVNEVGYLGTKYIWSGAVQTMYSCDLLTLALNMRLGNLGVAAELYAPLLEIFPYVAPTGGNTNSINCCTSDVVVVEMTTFPTNSSSACVRPRRHLDGVQNPNGYLKDIERFSRCLAGDLEVQKGTGVEREIAYVIHPDFADVEFPGTRLKSFSELPGWLASYDLDIPLTDDLCRYWSDEYHAKTKAEPEEQPDAEKPSAKKQPRKKAARSKV